jgi:hypothetical protein
MNKFLKLTNAAAGVEYVGMYAFAQTFSMLA